MNFTISRLIGKKGIEFSFNWMFAILVGSVLIFLGVYAASSIADHQTDISDATLSKQIGILLTPLQTSIESDKISQIHLIQDTKLYNDCTSFNTFGTQELSTSTRAGGTDASFSSKGTPSISYTKYIFSQKVLEGPDWIVYSKSFYFPFKVADVIYLTQKNTKYCFVSPPPAMEEDFRILSPPNINVSSQLSECPSKSITVCFTGGGCLINVDLVTQKVRKDRTDLYYSSLPSSKEDFTLLYAAIFSDPQIYECQVKRLMKRTSQLSSLYASKSLYLSPKGCSSNLEGDLISFSNSTFSLSSSLDLSSLSLAADQIRRTHDQLSCPLF